MTLISPSCWWLQRSAALAAVAGLAFSGLVPDQAMAQSDDVVVTRLCLAGFSAAFQAARQVAPPGMNTYACSCFVEQINQGSDLASAQSTCRERAIARYRM
ncbi:MAG: hypothetical protein N3Z28_04300 [Synechococcaceae cyanobacterium MAG-AL2]|nr:hypothetical protein [Candidatus Regnicoccus frigidus MAG-AL2]